MKKILAVLMLAVTITTQSITAFAQNTPEAFMGFSVTEDWLIFSKDMTDTSLLESIDMTKDEVNKILDNADCEYFLSNTKKNQRVYLKVEKNDLSDEFYNISKTNDKYLRENADRILEDGFSVDGFVYDSEDITFTKNSQMKLMTIQGIIDTGRKKEAMLLGATFVNGSGIAFMMHTDEITEETINDFNEIAGSISFTVIREKGGEDRGTGTSQTALKYIAGGLGVLVLAGILIVLVDRKKKTERIDEEVSESFGQAGNEPPIE